MNTDGADAFNPDTLPGSTVDYPQVYLEPKPGFKLLSAMSVFLIAFSCQQNLFPIFSELKEKNTRGLTIVFGSASFLVLTLYVIMSTISMYMFGSYNDVESTILDMISDHQYKPCTARNEQGECIAGDKPWQSYCLRILFLVVLFCHIPFIFFSGKEAILIAIDELDRKSISNALEFKMKLAKEVQENVKNSMSGMSFASHKDVTEQSEFIPDDRHSMPLHLKKKNMTEEK